MKKHELNLNDKPFNSIKSGLKTVEMRLFNEKRKKLKVDDIIVFTNRKTYEKIEVKITGLKRFDNFVELYKSYDKINLGYFEDEKSHPDDMLEYYSIEDQNKFGVLAIEIKLIGEK